MARSNHGQWQGWGQGRDRFIRDAPIHPDSLADYDRWAALLAKWNAKINLVSPEALPDFWVRHALDSAQLLDAIPESASLIVDFGSGAGFPGLAVAIEAKAQESDRHLHLIESAGKKTSFLKTVIRELALPATAHRDRIEDIEGLGADVITARAFAPLPRLLPLANQHLKPGGQLVLLKGENYREELSQVEADWKFNCETTNSLSGGGVILTMRELMSR